MLDGYLSPGPPTLLDGWLRSATTGEPPTEILRSGIVVSLASFSASETLAYAASLTSASALSASESINTSGLVAPAGLLSAAESIYDGGFSVGFVTPVSRESLADAGLFGTTAYQEYLSELVEFGSETGIVSAAVVLSALESLLDQGATVSAAKLAGFTPEADLTSEGLVASFAELSGEGTLGTFPAVVVRTMRMGMYMAPIQRGFHDPNWQPDMYRILRRN